jgi:proteasome lid subunit RPN8/RPN11
MTPDVVNLSATDRAELSRLALAASPAECCGLLVGRHKGAAVEITAIHKSENLAKDKLSGFEVDFRLRLHLEEELESGLDQIIGHYHSHPNGNSKPSGRDLADAVEPGLVWLILAVDGVGAVDLSAWLMCRSIEGEKSFSALPVVIK